ncbi:Protein phosphatase 1 regulatory subunit 3A [Blastocladiella emersonii ATCC 22665]|nr:Protein phosphatase 1 regulatory subunit 3A [Blastocladiella emersonii ATCC 22665]
MSLDVYPSPTGSPHNPAPFPHLHQPAHAHAHHRRPGSPMTIPTARSRSAPPTPRPGSPAYPIFLAAANPSVSTSAPSVAAGFFPRHPSPMSATLASLGCSPVSSAAAAAALRALSLSPRAGPATAPPNARHAGNPWAQPAPRNNGSPTPASPGARRTVSPSDGFRCKSPSLSSSPGEENRIVYHGAHGHGHGHGHHHRRSRSDSVDNAKLATLLADRLVQNAASAVVAAAAAAATAVAVAAANSSSADDVPLVFDLDLDEDDESVSSRAAPPSPRISLPALGIPLSAPIPQRSCKPAAVLPPRGATPPSSAVAPVVLNSLLVPAAKPIAAASVVPVNKPVAAVLAPPTNRRSVSFPSHLGAVRFFRHNDRPTEVSSARWSAVDEPEVPHFDYAFLAPNWPAATATAGLRIGAPAVPGVGLGISAGAATSNGCANPVLGTLADGRKGLLPALWGSSESESGSSRSPSPGDEAAAVVPHLAYLPTGAPAPRSPAPWDVVVVEAVQLAVGVCPVPLPAVVRRPKSALRSSFSATPDQLPATSDRVRVVGTVLVRNLAYEKRVTVRATQDFWRSFTDLEARYVGAGPAPGWDRFQFELDVTPQLVGSGNAQQQHATVYFCVHYQYFVQEQVALASGSAAVAGGACHVDTAAAGSGSGSAAGGALVSRWESAWDNNGGCNYEVVVKRREAPRVRSMLAGATMVVTDDVADDVTAAPAAAAVVAPALPRAASLYSPRDRVGAHAE